MPFSTGMFRRGQLGGRNIFNTLLSGMNIAEEQRRTEETEKRKAETELNQSVILELLKGKMREQEETAKSQRIRKLLGLNGESAEGGRNLQDITRKIPEGVTIDLGDGIKITGKGEGATAKEELRQAEQQLLNLDSLSNILEGQPSGRIAGTAAKISGFLTGGRTQTDIALYQQMKPAIAAGLYRNITGDKRLSDLDASARALPLLPDASEDKALQKRKVDTIKKLLNQRIEGLKKGKTEPVNLDVSGFGLNAQMENKIGQTSSGIKFTIEK